MSNDVTPSPNGPTSPPERDERGRFVRGNAGGPGNPLAGETARFRARLLKAIRETDVDLVVKVLRQILKSGKHSDQIAAARELLDRLVGKPVAADVLERIEQLELLLEQQMGDEDE
ncbi:MAG: hypothetical protein ACM359_15600 [Bacillota bacterium]